MDYRQPNCGVSFSAPSERRPGRWSLHLFAGANAIEVLVIVSNAWAMMMEFGRTELAKSPKMIPEQRAVAELSP